MSQVIGRLLSQGGETTGIAGTFPFSFVAFPRVLTVGACVRFGYLTGSTARTHSVSLVFADTIFEGDSAARLVQCVKRFPAIQALSFSHSQDKRVEQVRFLTVVVGIPGS